MKNKFNLTFLLFCFYFLSGIAVAAPFSIRELFSTIAKEHDYTKITFEGGSHLRLPTKIQYTTKHFIKTIPGGEIRFAFFKSNLSMNNPSHFIYLKISGVETLDQAEIKGKLVSAFNDVLPRQNILHFRDDVHDLNQGVMSFSFKTESDEETLKIAETVFQVIDNYLIP